MNIGVIVSLVDLDFFFFFDKYQNVGLLNHRVVTFLNFFKVVLFLIFKIFYEI